MMKLFPFEKISRSDVLRLGRIEFETLR